MGGTLVLPPRPYPLYYKINMDIFKIPRKNWNRFIKTLTLQIKLANNFKPKYFDLR